MIRVGDDIAAVDGVSLQTPEGEKRTLREIWDGKLLLLCFLRHLG